MGYKVIIVEELLKEVEIEAENEEEALESIQEQYNDGEIILDWRDLNDVEFYIK